MRLVWNESLETGIRQIDLQHEELLGIINELQDAHEAGLDETALRQALVKLTNYVLFHFATEENLMRSLAEPPVAHLQEHRAFVARLEEFHREQVVSSRQQVGKLIEFLCRWLIRHIMNTDRDLARQILQTLKVVEATPS